VTVVYVTGTLFKSASGMMGGDVKEMNNYALIGAIAEAGNDPWFFKATGPQETIDSNRETFINFIKSFKM